MISRHKSNESREIRDPFVANLVSQRRKSSSGQQMRLRQPYLTSKVFYRSVRFDTISLRINTGIRQKLVKGNRDC